MTRNWKVEIGEWCTSEVLSKPMRGGACPDCCVSLSLLMMTLPVRIRSVLVLLLLAVSSASSQYDAILFNGSNASGPDRLLAMTLAGIVNRDSSRLYLLNVYETWSYTQTDEVWRDIYKERGGVVFDSVATAQDLVDRFRDRIHGGISYDANRLYGNFPGQSFRWQGEYATLIGGLTDRLPVTAAMANTLGLALADSVEITDPFDGDSSVLVPGKLEYPLHPWNNGSLTEEQRYLTLMQWGVAELLPRCNPSGFYLREITDWAVKNRMFQVNIAGTSSLDLFSVPTAKADILEALLNHFQSKNPARIWHIYGWMYPEPMTQWFAFFGASFHETLLGNLSWHSSFPVAKRSFNLPSRIDPDTVIVEPKHYILLAGSEGDASNWNFSFQSGAWLSPARGSVPFGWGFNLHVFEECPFVAQYYYDTATPNDGFLSVTSPHGYSYPDDWPADAFAPAADSARVMMEKYGIREWFGYKHYAGTGSTSYRGKIILNSFDFPRYGQFLRAAGVTASYVLDPLIPRQMPVTNYGSVIWSVDDGSFYAGASDLTAYANRILNLVKTAPKPSFHLAGYQRMRQDDFASRPDPGPSDLSVSRLTQVAALLAADPQTGADIRLVTPQLFTALMRKHNGITDVRTQAPVVPVAAGLSAYPNPFNPTTTIGWRMEERGWVKVSVIDLLGREVTVLMNRDLPVGEHRITWNAASHPSGVYIVVLEAGSMRKASRLLLVR